MCVRGHRYIAIALFLLLVFQTACSKFDSTRGGGTASIDSGNGKGFGGETEDPPKNLVKIGNSKIHCFDQPFDLISGKASFLCSLYVVNSAGVEKLATGFADGVSVVFSLSGLPSAVENLLSCRNDKLNLSYFCSYDANSISSEISFVVKATTIDSINSKTEVVTTTTSISSSNEVQSDIWTPTEIPTAPAPRNSHSAVWTGSKMIIWGGWGGSSYLNTGGLYDPVTNSWTPTSTFLAPVARYHHSALWINSKMIIWGGDYGALDYRNDGGRFDPVTNTWSPTLVTTAPSVRTYFTAVSSGSDMIVWSGSNYTYPGGLNDGGIYHSSSNTWTAITSLNAPSPRILGLSTVWANSELLVWGGSDGSLRNDGSRYNPTTGIWTPISSLDAPSGRVHNSFLWTGTKLFIWGGSNGMFSNSKNDGGMYNPASNTWTAISSSDAPAPRMYHSTVLAGNKIIVFGGKGNSNLEDGGQYNLNTNSWTPLSLEQAPSERSLHSAIWTGSQMIVWGGFSWGNNTNLNDGSRYSP